MCPIFFSVNWRCMMDRNNVRIIHKKWTQATGTPLHFGGRIFNNQYSLIWTNNSNNNSHPNQTTHQSQQSYLCPYQPATYKHPRNAPTCNWDWGCILPFLPTEDILRPCRRVLCGLLVWGWGGGWRGGSSWLDLDSGGGKAPLSLEKGRRVGLDLALMGSLLLSFISSCNDWARMPLIIKIFARQTERASAKILGVTNSI